MTKPDLIYDHQLHTIQSGNQEPSVLAKPILQQPLSKIYVTPSGCGLFYTCWTQKGRLFLYKALCTAINSPDRVDGLILIGSPCTNQFNAYECIVVPINRFCQGILPMSFLAWGSAVALSASKPEVKSYIQEVVGNINHDVYNRAWKAITSMESREGLPNINGPTIILIGDHDWMTRRQQYMNEHIRGSRLVTIENPHHGTVFDNPVQVNREIELFM